MLFLLDKNKNPFRVKLLRDVYKNMKYEGLNSIEYNVTRVVTNKLYTHIYVDYDKMGLLSQKYVFLNETQLVHVDAMTTKNKNDSKGQS